MLGPSGALPRAILFRQVATPNYELRRFLRLCSRSGFTPVVLQFHADRMSCHNSYKRNLIAPIFVDGIGRNGLPFFKRSKLKSLEKVDNLRLSDIEIAGRELPKFHADLLLAALPNQPFLSIEASAWFGTYRGGAREYYVDLFQALIGDVLLLEDFVADGEEKRFFDDIVCPAFETASAILGRRPSIMQLCSNRRMASPLWYAYPASYRTHFQSLGCEI